MPDSAIPPESKAGAAFILSVVCHNHPKGQRACAQAKLVDVCLGSLQDGPTNVISGSTALLAQCAEFALVIVVEGHAQCDPLCMT